VVKRIPHGYWYYRAPVLGTALAVVLSFVFGVHGWRVAAVAVVLTLIADALGTLADRLAELGQDLLRERREHQARVDELVTMLRVLPVGVPPQPEER
jgi:hypothetical protein